jgi:hypothetical protein
MPGHGPGCLRIYIVKVYLFSSDAFLKEFPDQETRGDPRRHLQKAGLLPPAAAEYPTHDILHYVHGLQPVCYIRHPVAHMLLVDIILMFQVPDRLPQLFYIFYSAHAAVLVHLRIFRISILLKGSFNHRFRLAYTISATIPYTPPIIKKP